jgi:hypothetical protein
MRTDIQPETSSLRVQFMRFTRISVQRTHGSYIFPQIYTVLEMGQYLLVYHTGTYFVPEFHTGTYIPIISIFFPYFLAACPCFAFKKYTGTSKFPFRTPVLHSHTYYQFIT